MASNLITEIEVRSVLTAQNRRSTIPYDYTINPYRGCLLGCLYCYASRFVHEDAAKKADWGHWVEVKKNAVDALQRDSHKICGKTVFFSSATDPYQPLELRLGLTRALLEVLLLAFPARLRIQTRSPHVVRDIDLFRKFGDTLDVGISVPTDSDIVRRAFEPRAPSIARRLDAARQLKEAGIAVRASVAPLLPCTPERLARLLAPCFDRAWVDGINFYEKADALREIYTGRGWEAYLRPEHADRVRAALHAAGLL
uniref:Radical SAM domain protein n=1 Tax=uncultured Armatimonadetes bacterium TaxID=157466 RepID=A0A6J4I1W9_9BACT|nr:Radical SAM domain protein [uncultured Armatimonadetes bacterium]